MTDISASALGAMKPLDFASLAYMQAHLDFRENRTTQNARILDALIQALTPLRPKDRPFRIASIGAGTGILDAPLIEALLKDGPIDYTAIEPNRHELDDLVKRFRAIDGPLTIDTHNGLIEDWTPSKNYDAIIGVHVSYYSETIRPMLDAARAMRGDNGRAVFVVSTDMPGNRFFIETTQAIHGFTPHLSSQFAHVLDDMGLDYSETQIAAEIDLTAFFADPQAAQNRHFMNFYLHADTAGLSDKDYLGIVGQLAELVQTGEGAQKQIPHNATLFTF